MNLLSPRFRLTWYDGVYPSSSGEIVLLGDDDWIDDGSSLNGTISQLVDTREPMRGTTPRHFMRGNRRINPEWETVKEVDPGNPNAALEIAMDTILAMPSEVGWVRLDLLDSLRSFSIAPAAVESTGWRHDPRANLVRLRWIIRGGIVAEIPGDYSDLGILLLETGYPLLVGTGTFLKL